MDDSNDPEDQTDAVHIASPPHFQYPDLDQESPSFAWAGQQGHQADRESPNQLSLQSPPPGWQIYNGQPQSRSKRVPDTYRSLQCPAPSFPSSVIPEGPAQASVRITREISGDVEDLTFLDAFKVDDDELSEADSDYLNLQSDIAKFKDSVREIIAERRDHSSEDESHPTYGTLGGRSRGRGRGRGILRGPRKAAAPTGDIKFRMSEASQAFIEERYDVAKDLVEEVIRINAETHEAWMLLASIFKELGDVDKTLMALIYAAHLRPKDVGAWMSCAQFALEEVGDERAKYLPSAKFCYSSAIRANPKDDADARCGKAAVLRELGNTASAISEYKRVLKRRPHNTMVLRLLAEAYIDQDDVEAAKDAYRRSIDFYQAPNNSPLQVFGWSDINIFVELYGYAGQYADAIKELKSLSRWLLGRNSEVYWDQVTFDDREWDLDDSRRIETVGFVVGRYTHEAYGSGLPLELRTKLGLYRLKLESLEEALGHFNCLDPRNFSGEDRVVDYPDLYREAGDSLSESGYYKHALNFYETLVVIPEQQDPSLFLKMGICYQHEKLNTKAEECFQMAIQIDSSNVEARVRLAKMYEDLNEQEQAFIHVSEVMSLRRTEGSKQRQRESHDEEDLGDTFMPRNQTKAYYKPRRLFDPAERRKQEDERSETLQQKYAILRIERKAMRSGDDLSSQAWMDAAADLIDDFRGFKAFYPWDKYVHFLGYTSAAGGQSLTGATPLDADVAAMADRLSHKLGAEVNRKSNMTVHVPANYRGISFAAWLDIFLEYSLCLVKYGRNREAYEVCEAAKDAIVFYHSREDMFLIHVCWCTCAVLANDEETCVAVCRYFMKEYQFTTDSYRMFSALTRLCQCPVSWFNSGPTQKYMLRQIKAMDFALVDSDRRVNCFAEKGSYTALDEKGRPIVNDDMDVALLMLYGHILYTGTSYAYALNYFFRAYALDSENSMINLSIGLAYVQYGLKRQAENRQFHIMQGLSFLFRYYDSRRESVRLEERQEAHYNLGRVYHMLGLTHLALPFYGKVLSEINGDVDKGREDLVLDAVYNMQTLYAMGGNLEMARYLTDSWLVI